MPAGAWKIKRQACIWIAVAICIRACCRITHFDDAEHGKKIRVRQIGRLHPKRKTYISISAENKETAETIKSEICKGAEEYLK